MAFVRRVRTGSGATAVQVAAYSRGRQVIVRHFGSAHTVAEVSVLEARARAWIHDGQQELDLGLDPAAEQVPAGQLAGAPAQSGLFDSASRTAREKVPAAGVTGTSAGVLGDVLASAYRQVGLDTVDDEVFRRLVLARVVEPTSKRDALRVMAELGWAPVSYSTVKRTLQRIVDADYRGQVATSCFAHAAATTGLSLLLYDVSTLYFEAEREDEFRKIGYSKERRVDPQIVIGILVDRSGFPLELHSYEGDKAETHTIVPVIEAFQQRHQVADMVVVADAGMLSTANLTALDKASLRFIVGSRQSKAPHDLARHFNWHGTNVDDGTIVDALTPRARKRLDPARISAPVEPAWDPEQHSHAWRAVWQYRSKRARRDQQTLAGQRDRAMAIIEGTKTPKKARFVTNDGSGTTSFDDTSYQRALQLVGWKGYVTNIQASIMPPAEVIDSYHQLWHVEQSFRMSKSDLAARPIYHRLKDSIEAHLTIVFAALAVSRHVQHRTGLAIGNVIKRLRPLRSATIQINGAKQEFPPQIPAAEQTIIDAITNGETTH